MTCQAGQETYSARARIADLARKVGLLSCLAPPSRQVFQQASSAVRSCFPQVSTCSLTLAAQHSNRAARDLAAQIGQRTLDPPVAPIPVLRCHAKEQVLNLIPGSGPAGAALFAPIVFLGDQLPMPSQERLGSDDGGNFMKDATAQLFGLGCQAPTLVVVQTETLVPELLPEHPVLFAEVIDRVALLLTQPSGDRNQQQSKRVEGAAHGARIAAKTVTTGSATRTI